MALPVRHRPGSLLETSLPTLGWGEPVAAEFDELLERMNRLLETAATAPSAPAWSPAADNLPTEIKADEVNATLSDGVLTVTVPKAQAAKPRHVEIAES
ncbi:Hsp20 family protein [Streptomyces sp. NPDC001982]|uniref:Hsp20/alpha crystallin family protein n=1 Tax=unclassified Streptomyces TaxID=2593676 RepID=UPI003326A885